MVPWSNSVLAQCQRIHSRSFVETVTDCFTGLGLVTPLATGVQATWDQILAENTGVRALVTRDLKLYGADDSSLSQTLEQLPSRVVATVTHGSASHEFNSEKWVGQVCVACDKGSNVCLMIQYNRLLLELLLQHRYRSSVMLENFSLLTGSNCGVKMLSLKLLSLYVSHAKLWGFCARTSALRLSLLMPSVRPKKRFRMPCGTHKV